MIKLYDMLEAFFTRQRQRNIATILSALACLIWIGHFQTAAPTTSQASQTGDPTVSETTNSAPANQSYKQAEPIAAESADQPTSPETKPTNDSAQTTPSAPTFNITSPRIERTELSNGVVYDLHYTVGTTGNFGTPMIKTVLSGNRSCTEAAMQTYRFMSAGEQIIRCSLAAADNSADTANVAQFKLDISVDGISTAQSITYQWSQSTTTKP